MHGMFHDATAGVPDNTYSGIIRFLNTKRICRGDSAALYRDFFLLSRQRTIRPCSAAVPDCLTRCYLLEQVYLHLVEIF
jgi:hypothetical protein